MLVRACLFPYQTFLTTSKEVFRSRTSWSNHLGKIRTMQTRSRSVPAGHRPKPLRRQSRVRENMPGVGICNWYVAKRGAGGPEFQGKDQRPGSQMAASDASQCGSMRGLRSVHCSLPRKSNQPGPSIAGAARCPVGEYSVPGPPVWS